MDEFAKATVAARMEDEGTGRILDVMAPRDWRLPLIFASPHSGCDYPRAFLAASRLDATAIRRSEDAFVDELFASAVDHGAPLLKANFPRVFVDPNREAYELDPGMYSDDLPDFVNTGSARVGAGLGTIARVAANGEAIYSGKLKFSEAEARIETYYRPYHAALQDLIDAAKARFNFCILVDCHSMPSSGFSNGTGGTQGVDIVVGDNQGRSCAPDLARLFFSELAEGGFSVRRNTPYSGGFTVHQYGRPDLGVHAIQLEINRALYMNERTVERARGFAELAARLNRLIGALAKSDLPARLTA